MDIKNIVTEQNTETLDAEITAMTEAFTEEHYLNNDEAEHLEMIVAKSMVLGELYERAKWQAKSQAVPEGFVLVHRELSADEARKHAEAMFNKVERMARNEHRDLSESEFEAFKNRWIDARTLTIQFDWKAMIEAQEQSNG